MFGPSSPSPTRLKSWAGINGTAAVPSVTTKSETSGPARYCSITTRSQAAACARASSAEPVTTTPLPAARPSSLTTYGGPKSSSARCTSSSVVHAYDREVGTPAAAHHVLGEHLGPLEPGRGRGRPETGDALGPDGVGHAGHQRRLGSDHDQVGGQFDGEGGDRGRVGGGHLPQLGHLGDAGVAGGGDEEVDLRVGGQADGEGVFAPAGTDEKYAHGRRCYLWITADQPDRESRKLHRYPGRSEYIARQWKAYSTCQ